MLESGKTKHKQHCMYVHETSVYASNKDAMQTDLARTKSIEGPMRQLNSTALLAKLQL